MSDAPSAGPGSASDDPWWTDQPEPAKGPPRSGGRRQWEIAGAVVLVIAAAAGGVVLAISSKHSTTVGASAGVTSANGTSGGQFGRRRPGTQGTITAISGSNLTVTTSTKTTVSVATTGKTVITDTTKGSLADLKTGDHVRVSGAAAGSGPVTAQLVVDTRSAADQFGGGQAGGRRSNAGRPAGGYGLPEGGTFPGGGTAPNGAGFPGARAMTVGTIASRSGSTITVKTAAGKSVEFATTSTTSVRLTAKIALTDLAKGNTVTVTGSPSGATLTATAIRRGDAGLGFGRGGPGGRGPIGAPGATTTTP